MWDEVRNNPLLRIIIIIVTGALLFGFLFNMIAGNGFVQGGGGHMNNAGYGLSFGSLIGWLLMLLIRILTIVLIVSVIVGAFIWIRGTLLRESDSPLLRAVRNDPVLRVVSLVTLSIIGLMLIFPILGGFMNLGYGFNPVYGISWMLISLIKILMVVLAVSLIMAAVIYIKNQYEKGNLNWGFDISRQDPKSAEKHVELKVEATKE